MAQSAFPRDDRVEKWLQSFDVVYIREFVKVSTVDMKASLQNQARMSEETAYPEVVETYMRSIENGELLPPPVLWEKSKTRRETVDGNHRIMAMKNLDVDTFPAYLVAGNTKPA